MPPFEVTDQGWGEFEIHVQIFFHDCDEKPIEMSHILKLYPDGDNQQLNPNKPVVSERYDEIVFAEPSEGLRARLETVPSGPSPNGWRNHTNAKWFTVFDMETEFAQLQQARRPSPRRPSPRRPSPRRRAAAPPGCRAVAMDPAPAAGIPNGDRRVAERVQATHAARRGVESASQRDVLSEGHARGGRGGLAVARCRGKICARSFK